jgi:transposase-like protein
MKQTRRKFTPEFKTRVVPDAISERLSLSELAQKHELHPHQIAQWKREFLDKAPEIFSKGETAQKTTRDALHENEQLYKTIRQLKVDVDWLKKKLQS